MIDGKTLADIIEAIIARPHTLTEVVGDEFRTYSHMDTDDDQPYDAAYAQLITAALDGLCEGLSPQGLVWDRLFQLAYDGARARTQSEMVRMLIRAECRGVETSPAACPVSKWIALALPNGYTARVGITEVLAVDNIGHIVGRCSLYTHIRELITDFDAGDLPELRQTL